MGKPVGALEEEKKGERPSEAMFVCVCACAYALDLMMFIPRTEQTPAE